MQNFRSTDFTVILNASDEEMNSQPLKNGYKELLSFIHPFVSPTITTRVRGRLPFLLIDELRCYLFNSFSHV